ARGPGARRADGHRWDRGRTKHETRQERSRPVPLRWPATRSVPADKAGSWKNAKTSVSPDKGKGRRGGRLRRPFGCGTARGVAAPASGSRSPGGRCGAATTLTVLPPSRGWEGHLAGKG